MCSSRLCSLVIETLRGRPIDDYAKDGGREVV